MNWITDYVRPRIKTLFKKEVQENLWIKCPVSGQMVFVKDIEENQWVIPNSDYHMTMPSKERLKSIFDDGIWKDLPLPDVPQDPLKFKDERRYVDRIKDAKQKTGLKDAFRIGEGDLGGMKVVVAVQDFSFMGGSLGSAAGEAFVYAVNHAIKIKAPMILFTASGGARMQEGILSLMQMPKTTIATHRLKEHGLPYIVVLTNPTTGGVTASYAMLGDIHIAEPGALICFAGPRVIEQTIKEKLPDGFQRSEFLLNHGMIDKIVHRKELRSVLQQFLDLVINKSKKEDLLTL